MLAKRKSPQSDFVPQRLTEKLYLHWTDTSPGMQHVAVDVSPCQAPFLMGEWTAQTISIPSLQLPSPGRGTDLQVGQLGLGSVGGLERKGGNSSYPKMQGAGKQLDLQL